MLWNLIAPLIVLSVALYGLFRRVDIFSAMITGAKEGISVSARILPALVPLLGAITMLRSSGGLGALSSLCAPAFDLLGIPPECAPLIIIRPFSGSGALAMGAGLMAAYGPDSLIGRTTAVMLGSTETTFYAVSVICGAAGIGKTRYIIPAALLGDLAGYITAAAAVRWLF
ncbi:MAG: spore maturation protein [Oscillospiraceae bacterium]|nr:spore maturation protein [Oscillospiraceae bacterium]